MKNAQEKINLPLRRYAVDIADDDESGSFIEQNVYSPFDMISPRPPVMCRKAVLMPATFNTGRGAAPIVLRIGEGEHNPYITVSTEGHGQKATRYSPLSVYFTHGTSATARRIH